jgi:hypothetical protein
MATVPSLQLPGYAAPQTLDFSSLANLGNVYKQAQAEQGVKDAFANGVPTDAASLSQLGAQVGAYNPQLGLTLAQLGISAQNRQQDQERQAKRDAVADQHWQQSMQLQRSNAARAQANADREWNYDPTEDRTEQARAQGLDLNSPDTKSFILTGKLPGAESTVGRMVTDRQRAALANGLTPDSPGYQSYVLTGKMPREDAQPLTATDKKAILEADEHVQSAQQSIDNLKQAKELSKKAFSGPGASTGGYIGSLFGNEAATATTDLNNLVTSNALTQLKATFGSNPTEGERAILLQIQGSANLPDAVRQKIYDRGIAMAERRLKFNQQRVDALRGGSFYKSKNSQPATSAQSQGITKEQYDALAPGSIFTAPDGTVRTKP